MSSLRDTFSQVLEVLMSAKEDGFGNPQERQEAVDALIRAVEAAIPENPYGVYQDDIAATARSIGYQDALADMRKELV